MLGSEKSEVVLVGSWWWWVVSFDFWGWKLKHHPTKQQGFRTGPGEVGKCWCVWLCFASFFFLSLSLPSAFPFSMCVWGQRQVLGKDGCLWRGVCAFFCWTPNMPTIQSSWMMRWGDASPRCFKKKSKKKSKTNLNTQQQSRNKAETKQNKGVGFKFWTRKRKAWTKVWKETKRNKKKKQETRRKGQCSSGGWVRQTIGLGSNSLLFFANSNAEIRHCVRPKKESAVVLRAERERWRVTRLLPLLVWFCLVYDTWTLFLFAHANTWSWRTRPMQAVMLVSCTC